MECLINNIDYLHNVGKSFLGKLSRKRTSTTTDTTVQMPDQVQTTDHANSANDGLLSAESTQLPPLSSSNQYNSANTSGAHAYGDQNRWPTTAIYEQYCGQRQHVAGSDEWWNQQPFHWLLLSQSSWLQSCCDLCECLLWCLKFAVLIFSGLWMTHGSFVSYCKIFGTSYLFLMNHYNRISILYHLCLWQCFTEMHRLAAKLDFCFRHWSSWRHSCTKKCSWLLVCGSLTRSGL